MTAAALFTLPKNSEVAVIASRKVENKIWNQLSFKRRTGWVKGQDIEKIVEKVLIYDRRRILEPPNERELDKARMFQHYDIERREREFLEVLGDNKKYLTRPIRRTGLSKYQIEDLKEEVY